MRLNCEICDDCHRFGHDHLTHFLEGVVRLKKKQQTYFHWFVYHNILLSFLPIIVLYFEIFYPFIEISSKYKAIFSVILIRKIIKSRMVWLRKMKVGCYNNNNTEINEKSEVYMICVAGGDEVNTSSAWKRASARRRNKARRYTLLQPSQPIAV